MIIDLKLEKPKEDKIIPLVIGGILGVIGLSVGFAYILDKIFNKQNKIKLSVLGMESSGKTLFLQQLNSALKGGVASGISDYDEFVINLGKDKDLLVRAGKDIPGSNAFVNEYEKLCQEGDVIVYLFDISKYLNEEDLDYRRQCNSRLELIYDYGSQYQKLKNITIIGSHIDVCNKSEREAKKILYSQLQDKTYFKLLENLHLVNITDKRVVKGLIKPIFERYA
ncbi:hypothetical protein VJ786_01990 [Sphingobacterium sp. PU5-4]|uniref:G domain-containing protein n=1 Tax=Sphingobacterium tenebrionis TaxID=3111775 RepID=A0ABU8I2M1_9SPHI